MLISTGCSTTNARLNAAGTLVGQIKAGVNLRPMPEICLADIRHAILNTTDDVRVLLRRERRQLTRSNTARKICADWYREYAKQLANPVPTKTAS
jgi:hypothetical protein